MDEIKQRLTEASQDCIRHYEAWRGKPLDHQAREDLLESIHELRKVTARLEIELAVSDRQQHAADPIPIPAHRASRRMGGDQEAGSQTHPMAQSQQQPSDHGYGRGEGPSPRASRQVQIRRGGGFGQNSAAPSMGSEPSAESQAGATDPAAPAIAAAEEAPRRGRPPLSLRNRTAPDAE